MVTKKITVQDTEMSVIFNKDVDDYICLTDMARFKDRERTNYVIQNWIRSRSTIEFIGIWEQLNNPNFKSIEFDAFRENAGLNSFTLTPKEWAEKTGAIGIYSKAGRYGGTYAHKDIAFNFGIWNHSMQSLLSKEFQESNASRFFIVWQKSNSQS